MSNGKLQQFEVRFGDHAVSTRMKTPPSSGMVQVNIKDQNTRVVRQLDNIESALEPLETGAVQTTGTVLNTTAVSTTSTHVQSCRDCNMEFHGLPELHVCRRDVRNILKETLVWLG